MTTYAQGDQIIYPIRINVTIKDFERYYMMYVHVVSLVLLFRLPADLANIGIPFSC